MLINAKCTECGVPTQCHKKGNFAICRNGHRFVPAEAVTVATTFPSPYNRVNAWSLLHGWCAAGLRGESWSPKKMARLFESEFVPRIPSYSCNCVENFRKLRLTVDIDWSTPKTAFETSVALHNAVSVEHAGHPAITLNEAYKIWLGPRVAFLISSYLPVGGTETFHRCLVPRLRHRMQVVGFGCTAFVGGDPRPLQVPYYTDHEEIANMLRVTDVVVTWGLDNLEPWISPLPKQPHVISVHHSDSSSLWSNRLQDQAQVSSVVCVNPDTAKTLSSQLPVQVHHIANCVDPNRITPTPVAQELRKRWNIPKDDKVLLFAHRLSEEKQPAKAIAIGNALPSGWTTIIAGDGALASQLKPSPRVRVVGPVPHLADWFSVSDCFISLSTYDGYGLSVAEALAYGLPTVSTPRGIGVGRATLVDAGDSVSEWCRAITKAVDQPRKKHSDLCDIDRFVDQWVEVCREGWDAN